MPDEKRETTENIFGEFGFTVRWKVQDHWADVEVFDIVAIDDEGNLYPEKDYTRSDQRVRNIDEAESYLDGYMKWFGCCELDQGCPHWCSVGDYKKHIKLLEYLYKRSYELMGREPEETWE